MTGEPTSSGVMWALILKIGALKLFGMFMALLGALLIAACRKPKNFNELFLHGMVAMGASFLFGGEFVRWVDYYMDSVDLHTATMTEVIEFSAAAHGLLGALSWGVVAMLATARDKIANIDIAEFFDRVRGK